MLTEECLKIHKEKLKWFAEHEIQTTFHGKDQQIHKSEENAVVTTPSMTKWVPIHRNFVTKDSEELQRDDSPKDVMSFGARIDRLDDEMFANLVRKLIPYQYGVISSSPLDDCPDAIIFQSISSYFDGNYTADKYAKLTNTCTPNVDDPTEAPIPPHQSLRSYRKYFCRRCFIYNCQLHPTTISSDMEAGVSQKNNVEELKPLAVPCSNTCYLTEAMKDNFQNKENVNTFDACGKIILETVTQNMAAVPMADTGITGDADNDFAAIFFANSSEDRSFIDNFMCDLTQETTFGSSFGRDVIEEFSNISSRPTIPATNTMESNGWTFSDETVFLALLNVFPYNCCTIAKIMQKSCELVYKKMQSTNPPTRIGIEKKTRKKLRGRFYGNLQQHLTKTYSPCSHPGPCDKKTASCSCLNCEKYCSCDSDCKKRVPKCQCKGVCISMKCICYCGQRECDPDMCECRSCKNTGIQYGCEKKLQVIRSSIHGLGVAVAESCEKSDFISEYKGEIISNKECERREKEYVKQGCTYLFVLNGDSVIDVMFYGNKLRFMNFSEEPNCYCRVMMVNGDHRIGVYAARKITAGEELTIDYFTYDPTVSQ